MIAGSGVSAVKKVCSRASAGLAVLSAVALISVVPLVIATSPAGAAGTAGYPPPVTTNSTCSLNSVVQVGSTGSETLTTTFAPGTAVDVSLNGAHYSTVTAPSPSGIETLNVVVTDPHISINGGPVVPANDTDTIVAAGANSTGGTNTCTVLLTLDPGTTSNATFSPSTSSQAALAAKAGQPLAFTGADILAAVVGGLALLAVGFLLVIFTRSRSTRRSSPA